MHCERCRGVSLEAKLVNRRRQEGLKDDPHGMLEYFAKYRSYGDAPIIVQVTFVSMIVFDYGHNGSALKLSGNTFMHEHGVDETLHPLKKHQWSVKKVLGKN